MLANWGIPIAFYLAFVMPLMACISRLIVKRKGRGEIPDSWKVPITRIFCATLVYVYDTSGSGSGWPAVGLFAVSVAIEKIIQFWWGPKTPSNPAVKRTS